MEPSKRARIIKKLLPEATRLFGKKGAKGWLRATTAAVHLPYPTPNPTVPEKHQIRIAKDTLKMSDAGARIMGGMTKEQAREILRKHGIRFKENSNGNGNGAATRRRQGSGAQAGYADFHGRSPKEVLEMTETHLQSGDYYSLGDITGLWLRKVNGDPNGWGRATLEFDKKDGVLLAASEDSNRQLYILGDDCCISLAPLRELGLDTGKQFIPLGPVYGIGYMTEKKFDGFQTTEYVHRFGDVTGEVPSAFYDKKAKRILLVGGGYSIAPLDDEMGASPGIVN